jgi:hypothetical protein
VANLAPIKERLAKCIRLFGSAERANARIMTERALASVGASWTDLGDWIEQDSGKYNEAEMQEFAQAARAEGVEAGIKIGMARASNSSSRNGHLMLPSGREMAQYCHDRLGQLRDDNQRKFITEVYLSTQRGGNLPRGPLGYLASIYIKNGGRT